MMLSVTVLAVWLATELLVPAARDDALRTAESQFEAGRYQAAVSTLREALAGDPQVAELRYWLARCYYELRDYDSASKEAEQAVKLDPGNSRYHQWLGRAYGGKAEESRSLFLARKVKGEFEEAVRLDGANISARRDLMEYYVEAPWIAGGSKEKARQQIDAIARLDPVEGHLARAVYWRNQEEASRAAEEYGRVLELEPRKVEPYFEAADFYQRESDALPMRQAVEAAARLDASDPRLAFYRGVALVLEEKRLAEAEQLLRLYLNDVPPRSEFPSHAAAREWMGRLFEKMGKPKEAAEQYRAALGLDPDRKGAREALRRLGNP